jgi:sulfite exporter TauE/SafE
MSRPTSKLLGENAPRLLIGSAIAQLAGTVGIHHGSFTSLQGVSTVAAAVILFAFGMTLTIMPVVNALTDLKEQVGQL